MGDVWKHFKKLSGERAQCLECPQILQCKGSSTSGLWRHLKNKHNLPRADTSETPMKQPKVNDQSNQKQSSLDTFVKRETLQEIVARLAALDGISVAAISKSRFIRESVSARGFKLPKSKSAIMNLIHKYFDEIKDKTKQEIHNKIHNNKELVSLTMDEWTSPANKRYLNVNVHFADGSCYNLGLFRIHGSFPTEKIVQAVEQITKDFGIDVDFITAATTDGASTMVKFGKIVPYFHQLCYNHALHLAVQDVLNHIDSDGYELSTSDDNFSSESEDDEYEDIETDESQGDSSGNGSFSLSRRCSTKRLGKILKQIRTIVRLFRRSPVKNSVLQEKVLNAFGKEIKLLLDMKTRWNSTEKMLVRFIKLYECIVEALRELRITSNISREDFALIKSLTEVLQPIRLVSEALGRRDATLLTAEGSLSFLFLKLKNQKDNPIASKLFEAVLKRINERRNIKLVSLMKFLHNNQASSSSPEPELPVMSRNQLFKFVKEDCARVFSWIFSDHSDTTTVQTDDRQHQSLEDELEASIQQHAGASNAPTLELTGRDNFAQKVIQKELTLYELTGELTPGLKVLFTALKSIKPTSTDSERVFSDSMNICSKRRLSLSDASISKLCFLKSYFKRSG